MGLVLEIKDQASQTIVFLRIFVKCLLHEELGLRYLNVAYMTYFLMPTIWRTLSNKLRTILQSS